MINNMHYYDVVSPEQLLNRLIIDANKPLICSELTLLLLNNFYPQQLPINNNNDDTITIHDLQLERCLKLIQQDIRVAILMYSNLHKHINLGSVTKFVVNLFLTFNNDMDEINTAILKVLNNNNNKHNKNNNILKLINHLNTTFEIPIGLLQVIISIMISVKDKLGVMIENNENNGTIDLFNNYFTLNSFMKLFELIIHLFQPLNELIISSNDFNNNEFSINLYSKYCILLSLNLQLISICNTIDPAIVQFNSANNNKKTTKKSKTIKKDIKLDQIQKLFIETPLNTLQIGIQLYHDNKYSNIINILSNSVIESISMLNKHVIIFIFKFSFLFFII